MEDYGGVLLQHEMMHRGKLVPSARWPLQTAPFEATGKVARLDCTFGGVFKQDLITIVLTAEACAQLLR
jgi:hypothetical protein